MKTITSCFASAAFVICLMGAGTAHADLITTALADYDAHAISGSVFDGGSLLRAGAVGSGADQRAFIHWDLNDLADPTLPITDAKVRVRFADEGSDIFGGAFLREITSAWTVGTLVYGQSVGSPIGGDFLPGTPVVGDYYEIDVTSELLAWQFAGADPADFFGFSIRGSEGFTSTRKDFNSQESLFDPQLVIAQIVPEPNSLALWGILGSIGLLWAIRRRRFAKG